MADIARLLEGMVAKRTLKLLDYKVYLCLFSRGLKGELCTEKHISEITGTTLKVVQKKTREIEKKGHLKRVKDREEWLLYLTFPVTSKQAINKYESPPGDKKDKSKKVDWRFKELVDRLFEIYEKETSSKLNPLFGAADGKMIARLLKNLPEENVTRLCNSFTNFLRTDNDFDAEQINRAPVRYWATRINAFLPKKQFDVVESYRRKYGNTQNV